MEYGTILTAGGLELISKLLACKGALKITRAVVGDGELSEGQVFEELKDIINKVSDAVVAGGTYSGNGEASITVQISSAGVSAGYFIKEVGVYAEDPETGEEILYAYLPLQDSPVWISPQTSPRLTVAIFDLIVVVGRVNSVEISISAGALVLREELEKYALIGHRHEIPDVNGLLEMLQSIGANTDLAVGLIGAGMSNANTVIGSFANMELLIIRDGMYDAVNNRMTA